MNKSSLTLLSTVLAVFGCCSLFACGGAFLALLVSYQLGDSAAGTDITTPAPSAAATRAAARTPAPTLTLVNDDGNLDKLEGTPAPPRIPVYEIIVPTPTSPRMAHPIGFDSSLIIDTYPVTGVTFNELSRSLNAYALPDPHEPSAKYYARTDWYMKTQWEWNATAQACEVRSGHVGVQMTITLPIQLSSNVPPDVATRWTRFVSNTITHETGHVQLDLQGARAYQEALGNFSAAPDCGTLKLRLQTLFDTSSARIDEQNIDYDARTRHGATQGAIFP